MTAAEQYADAIRVLGEMRGVVEAGTPGLEVFHSQESDEEWIGFREPAGFFRTFKRAGWGTPNADAALITLAVNALGPMLDGWESVLGRHRLNRTGDVFCWTCDETWPCPDARAVLGALGINPAPPPTA